MEGYLASVKGVLKEQSGGKEGEALSNKIVSSVRDFMVLDVIKGIETSSSPASVCSDMLDNLGNSRVCLAGIQRLFAIWEEGENDDSSERLEEINGEFGTVEGFKILTSCMANHTDDPEILALGFNFIQKTALLFGFAAGSKALLETPDTMNVIVKAIRKYPDNVHVQEAALSTFHPLEQSEIHYFQNNYEHGLERRFPRYLVETEAVPLLFAGIQNHPTNHEVVYGSLTGLYSIGCARQDETKNALRSYIAEHPDWKTGVDHAVASARRIDEDIDYVRRQASFLESAIEQL